MTRGSRLALLSMAAVPLAVYGVFVLVPLAWSFAVSLTDWNGLSPVRPFIALGNYDRGLRDPLFINALRNTALWLVVGVVVPTAAGLGLAVLLDRPLRGSRLYKTAFYLPVCLSLAIVGQVWIWIYQPDIGLINTILRSVGLDKLAVAWLARPNTALWAVIFAWCWQQTALSLILYLAALSTVPQELVEAAAIDGASGRQAFRRVVFPLLRPATTVVVALGVIGVLKGFDVVYMLTEGGPFHSSDNLAMMMYTETFRKYQLGYGASISTALFVLAIIVIVVYFRQARAAERLYG
jgi:multiple sugar transport system permease protein/raffinose/stachyose/melibiose transport system permease protein